MSCEVESLMQIVKPQIWTHLSQVIKPQGLCTYLLGVLIGNHDNRQVIFGETCSFLAKGHITFL